MTEAEEDLLLKSDEADVNPEDVDEAALLGSEGSDNSKKDQDDDIKIGLEEEMEEDDDGDIKEEEDSKQGIENDEERPRRMTTRSRTRRVDPPSSEEDEESDEEEEKMKDDHPALLQQQNEGIIKVGADYQAAINESDGATAQEEEERETALWLPPAKGLKEEELMEFCEEAMGVYMLSYDRALYILQRSGYDYKKAIATIQCRKVVKEEWTDDDCLLFRQAFCLYGKNFARIRQTMPHRSMASIINHYYSTKKQQDYKSLIEMRAEKPEKERKMEGDCDNTGLVHSSGRCENCFEQVDELFLVDESKQCNTCRLYYKLMLKPRPVSQESSERPGRRGIRIDEEYMDVVNEFIAMAEQQPETRPEETSIDKEDTHMSVCVFKTESTKAHQKLREVEREMMLCRARTVRIEHAVKIQKQEILEKPGIHRGVDRFRHLIDKESGKGGKGHEDERGRQRMQYSWTEVEKITAFHCFMRYGRDFEAVADVVGTKTADMVKSFYSELKADIDELIDETNEHIEEEAATRDKAELLKLPERQAEVVDLD